MVNLMVGHIPLRYGPEVRPLFITQHVSSTHCFNNTHTHTYTLTRSLTHSHTHTRDQALQGITYLHVHQLTGLCTTFYGISELHVPIVCQLGTLNWSDTNSQEGRWQQRYAPCYELHGLHSAGSNPCLAAMLEH